MFDEENSVQLWLLVVYFNHKIVAFFWIWFIESQ